LIELLVTLVIMGVLAAIAYPTYLQHVMKGRRAAAEAALMDIAQRQQQYLLDARSYASDVTTLSYTVISDVTNYYTVSIVATAGPPPTFTATATPISGTAQTTDVTLSINNVGTKTPAGIW